MIPVTDCRRQYETLADDVEAAVMRVLRSGRYLRGEETERFEQEFAEYCGVKHVVGVANGTDALEIALRAAGCGPQTEVITVANAGMYSSAAVVQVGATPVFADIDDATLLLCADSLRRMLSQRTRVVVATHLYGKLVDVQSIRSALGNRDIIVVEDCAQAHGAHCRGSKAGSLGDIAAFSFYPTKNLGALGDAGAIATNRDDLELRVRQLGQHGWSDRFHAQLSHGRNSRIDEIQSAVLRVKLPHLDEWNRRRQTIVSRYIAATDGGTVRIVHAPSDDFVAHLCVARHPRRDEVRDQLRREGIGTAVHYPVPDHQQPAMRNTQWRADALPTTELTKDEIFSLPCYPEMVSEEIEHVCAVLRRIE